MMRIRLQCRFALVAMLAGLGSACARAPSGASHDVAANGTSLAEGSAGAPAAADEKASSASANPSAAAAGAGGTHSDAVPRYAASVENTGVDCDLPALPEPAQLPKRNELPDPFLKLDGTRIARRSEWRCRRQEIRAQAEKYIYGTKPPKPESVRGVVSPEAVSVEVQHAGKDIRFSAEVVLPSQGQKPFPAIINLGPRNAFGGTRLGESFILEQGVALIYYNHNQLGTEGKPEASRGLPNPGLFYDLYGGTHSAGLLMAWAWGASRLLDVLQAAGDTLLDSTRIGVTGCSRNGKGAFTVGAFDERIALTIPQETSTGGLPSYRIVDVLPGAERTNYNYYGLNWLSNVFAPFVENASQLPIDSHEIVALVAPRGLLVLDNPHIAQFAASAAYPAVMAGAEVYAALGAAQNVSYVSNVVDEKHCAVGKPEYTAPLVQSIGKFLKRERDAARVIDVGAKGDADVSKWKPWQAPNLQDDVSH